MKRPICIASVFYIIGILLGLYSNAGIAFVVLGIILILGIYLTYKKKVLCIILTIISIIGYFQVSMLNNNYELILSQIPTKISIQGKIVSNKIEKDYKYTYTIKVSKINGKRLEKELKFILNLKKNKVNKKMPEFGDFIELSGEVSKPQSARNYKGFDYKQYLKSKNIYGTIDTENYKIIANNSVNKFSTFVNKVQNNMKKNMLKILKQEEGALCIGILIGDRENISSITEENFKESNLTHMLAVSGSHITYIIVAFTSVIGRANRKYACCITIVFLIFFSFLTGFTASVLRASIMGILTLVASILYRKSDTINNLAISSFLILLYNPFLLIDVGFLLSYAGTIGIIFFSDRILKIFRKLCELSSKIFKLGNKNTKENVKSKILYKCKIISDFLINSLSITISANIIIIPIMAYMFSTVSLTFWVSNLLAGPVMEVVTIFGFAVYFISLIFPILAEFLGIFLNLFLTILLKIAEISSKIPGSSIYIKTPSVFACIIFYIIILALFNLKRIKILYNKQIPRLLKRGLKDSINRFYNHKNKLLILIILFSLNTIKKYKLKIIACMLIIIIGTRLFTGLLYEETTIYFIDVGQGDCTLIELPKNIHILIDGGGSEFGTFDVGESTLVPYLLDRGITSLEYLMISHFDSDHIGGLFAVIENIKVKNIIISRQGENSENLKKLKELITAKNKTNIFSKHINLIIVKKGDYIKINENTYFEILFPESELISENILNNNSIVAKFIQNNFSILFTGDIEEIAEQRLCELYQNKNKLQADIIKVAHHGSKTSSTTAFLELVKPKIALVGVGANNNFGHPNDEVLNRLNSIRCKNL